MIIWTEPEVKPGPPMKNKKKKKKVHILPDVSIYDGFINKRYIRWGVGRETLPTGLRRKGHIPLHRPRGD